jgi:ferredoxin
MKLRLDNDLCVGHGRCYALAPELFDADDRGHCVLKYEGDIPVELETAARTGSENCPEDALILE